MRFQWTRKTGTLLTLSAVAALGSCNSSDNNSDTNTTQSAAGVWLGTDATSGLDITAIIAASGQATFIRGDGVQFDGDVQVSGSTLAAAVTGYTNFDGTFTDGSTYGLGTVNATVTTQSAIDGTLSFTTNGGTSITGSWQLGYASYATSGASVSAVTATYTDTVTGGSLTINSAGALTGTNPTNGCVLNGTISAPSSSYNVYQVSYTLGNCAGTADVLDGIAFTGLATLNNSISPVQLIIAVAGSSSTAKYAIVSTLNAS
jgi:hypothetical protein